MVLASYAVGKQCDNIENGQSIASGTPEVILVDDVLFLDEDCFVEFSIGERHPEDPTNNHLIITYVDVETTHEYGWICLQDIPSDVEKAIRSGNLNCIYDVSRKLTLNISPDNVVTPETSRVFSKVKPEHTLEEA